MECQEVKLPSSLQNASGVVLDTMFFIYLFEDSHRYADLCEHLIAKMADGFFAGIVTPVTVAEIIVKPLDNGRADIADQYLSSLRTMKNISFAPMTFEVGRLAGALRSKYKRPLPDMIQAAFSMQGEKPVLITNDRALGKVKEIKILLLDEMLSL